MWSASLLTLVLYIVVPNQIQGFWDFSLAIKALKSKDEMWNVKCDSAWATNKSVARKRSGFLPLRISLTTLCCQSKFWSLNKTRKNRPTWTPMTSSDLVLIQYWRSLMLPETKELSNGTVKHLIAWNWSDLWPRTKIRISQRTTCKGEHGRTRTLLADTNKDLAKCSLTDAARPQDVWREGIWNSSSKTYSRLVYGTIDISVLWPKPLLTPAMPYDTQKRHPKTPLYPPPTGPCFFNCILLNCKCILLASYDLVFGSQAAFTSKTNQAFGESNSTSPDTRILPLGG